MSGSIFKQLGEISATAIRNVKTNLETAIDTEIASRISAETTLQQNIDSVASSLGSLIGSTNSTITGDLEAGLSLKADLSGAIFTGTVTAPLFVGPVTGNATTATKLETARTISTIGDIIATGTFDGSANLTLSTTLASTGVTAGTYGSSTNIPQLVIDTKGRITSASNVSVFIPSGSITFTGDVLGSGNTGGSTSLTLSNTGVTAGTYNNNATSITPLTVDAKGRITATGTSIVITPSFSSITSKPTTIAGYGITDSYTKSQIDNLISSQTNTNAVSNTTLQANIDVEKARVDAILSASSADKDSFKEIVDLINSVDTTNDASFAGYVASNNARSTKIESDLSARTDADTTLQNNIDSLASLIVSSTGSIQSDTFESLSTKADLSGATFTGTVTAPLFVGPVTGNATTATKLETARTIAGVSFDGSANISIPFTGLTATPTTLSGYGITDSYTKAETETAIETALGIVSEYLIEALNNDNNTVSTDTLTTLLNEKASLTGATFTGIVTAPAFIGTLTGNATTATKLETSRTINGISFDGTSNIELTFDALVAKPTTVSGYGITDVYTKSQIDTAISTEASARTTANTTLQNNIDSEKARIDAILLSSSADKDSFKEIVDLINSVDTTNDTAFAGYVTSNNTRSTKIESDLSAETMARTDADTTLQNNIDSLASLIGSSTAGVQTTTEEALLLKADLSGAIFTGTVTAPLFIGPITGNATTSTKLETARTINGIAFDGTENIVISDNTKQPLDADLTAIAGLTGTNGILKKTAADTWTLDTNTYLTSNQNISISGDVTGSGTTALNLTLSNSGVTAGTYKSVTVDAKGRVTAGTNPTTLVGYGITDSYTKTEIDSSLATKANTASLSSVATSGNYNDLTNKPAIPTIPSNVSYFNNDASYQTLTQVNNAIQAVVGAAPAALDTLKEIADKLANDESAVSALTTVVSNKADKATTLTGYGIVNAYTKTEVDAKILELSPQTDLSGLYTKNETDAFLAAKVDKIVGKGLSTEDFTTSEKTKLAGLNNYSLPIASATTLGGVKAGTNISIDANGVISANDTSVSWSEITSKPTTLAGYGITDAQSTLVSGTNIRSINGISLLGSGDISIGAVAKLETARTITLTGDASGSVAFDGTTNVDLNVTINANSVELGTDTTGDYVKTINGGAGITIGNTTSEANTVVVSITDVGTAGTYAKVTTNSRGQVVSGGTLVATDIPSLDASKITTGTIDAARLPSFVDDVLEFSAYASFPVTGETGKIYIDLTTNKTYRWSGSVYVVITSGAVDSVNGQTGIVNITTITGNAGSATKLANARTINGVSFDGTANITVTDSTKQPLDADLTAIASLAGTNGILKKTATDTWTLDTNTYLTTNQNISISGDANGSGSTNINLSLIDSGVAAGSYGSSTMIPTITVDAKGRVTNVTTNSVSVAGGSISVTGGDITLSGSIGTAITNATLSNTGVIAGLYGSATLIPSITVDAKGRITSVTTNSISIPSGSISVTGGDITLSGTTGSSITNATLSNTGVIAGTYKSVTVDAKGRITSGNNPSTLAGFGINDSYTKTEIDASLATKANNASLSTVATSGNYNDLTNKPVIPSVPSNVSYFNNDSGYQTLAQVNTAIQAVVGAAPAALDTLKEIADKLASDESVVSALTTTVAGKQPLDADLTAIAGLTGTNGILKKTAADTWTLDTNTYLTGNQSITVSGDVSGSGTTALSLTLANSGVTAGTYGSSISIPSITVDAKGRVTSVTTNSVSVSMPSTSINVTGGDLTLSGSTGSNITNATLSNTGVTAGTYAKVTVDTKGRVTAGTTLVATDIPSLDASIITSGTIDPARLPSYVSDIVEAANLAAFPATGITGKMYIALDTNKTYRWSGSTYVNITSGGVDSVAGKTGVVTLVKGDVGLGNVDNTADSVKNVLSASKLATSRTINGVAFDGTSSITITDDTKLSLTGGTLTGSLSGTAATFSGDVSALNFNSTSDERLKTNIKAIPNALETVKSLNGVSFDWKENGQSTFGVIAQQIEKIIPELVVDVEDHKTVNYNGLIGFLINAVKELSDKVDSLQNNK